MGLLEKNKQLRAHLDDIIPDGVERIADEPEVLESMAAPAGFHPGIAEESEVARAREAARRLAAGEDLDEDDLFVVEAIVLPEGRPAIDIRNDSFTPPGSGLWAHLGDSDIKARLEAAIPCVGRVELPDHPQLPFGGTAFVVSPSLVMTNRHVAEIFAHGLGRQEIGFRSGQSAAVDFKRERASFASRTLRVREVVMIHPYWDMALLRVEGLPADHPTLSLSIEEPRDMGERDVGVIGYPALDSRNDFQLQRRIYDNVFNVKRLQPGKLGGRQTVNSFGHFVSAFKHNATTLGGCSGSAVVDLTTGEVIGLHFAGRYKVANWGVPSLELAADPFVVDAGVRFAGSLPGVSFAWQRFWDDADPQDEGPGASAAATAATAAGSPTPAVAEPGADGMTWTIPLQVSVRLGSPALAAAAAGGAVSPAPAPAPGGIAPDAAVEKPPTRPSPDYSTREGYDPGFLGDGDLEVRIPWLTDEQYEKVAFHQAATSDRHVLPYHHFSVVMNAERRIAYFTVVNVDGTREVPVNRADFRDFWSGDPRIDPGAYLDNDAYREASGVENPLDRGHLVRRLDPCWGDDMSEVLGAHHDTFHWTNCSPQHERFNRNHTTWGGVENHILRTANVRDLRVTVLTGPVFRDDDPVYDAPAGVRVALPRDYWKVVAWVKEDGALAATAFVISQRVLVDDLVEMAFTDAFEQFQTTVRAVEKMTGLSFWQLAEHDPLADPGVEEAPGAAPPKVPLTSYGSIVL